MRAVAPDPGGSGADVAHAPTRPRPHAGQTLVTEHPPDERERALTERVHELEQVVEEYRVQMQKVLTSSSWRVTSPVRLAAGTVRWHIGRLRSRMSLRRWGARIEVPMVGIEPPAPDRLPETSPLRRLTDLRHPAVPRGNRPPEPVVDRAAVLVIAHVHYPALWADLAERIGRLPMPYDLIVSVTRGHGEHALPAIRASHPDAQVDVVPNQGRDWAPLVSAASRGLLTGYAAVAKVHTKRSEHRLRGHTWRLDLLDGVFPSPPATQRMVDLLIEDAQVGMIVPGGHVSGPGHWGSNQGCVEALACRLPLPFRPDRLAFPAGSMFWCRPSVLARLADLHLTTHHFELEVGQFDGTTAHALERLVGVMCTADGLDVIEHPQVAHRLREHRRRVRRPV
ncbi:MAG: hypothetical protein KGP10_06520 [Actinomycetales bacterium]|nr:hypothetical protein [Actinomycetales bacterium]